MNEIQFFVGKDTEGVMLAHAFGASIFTEADDTTSLLPQTADVVRCHFHEDSALHQIILC